MTSLHKDLRHLLAFYGCPPAQQDQAIVDIDKLYQKAMQNLLNFELEQKTMVLKYGVAAKRAAGLEK